MGQGADNADGLRRLGQARRDGPLPFHNLVLRPLNRLQTPGLDPHQGYVIVFIDGQQLGLDFLAGGQPASEFARLDLAGFGQNQAVGIDDRPQRHPILLNVQPDDGVARLRGNGGKRIEHSLPAVIAGARQFGSTDNPSLFLENGFDFVLRGESEETLVRLCSSLLSGEAVPEIDGLVRLGEGGGLVQSGRRLAKNPMWTELARPARDLIDLEPYRAAWAKAHGYFSTNMVASRGCPYRCNWCAKPISGNTYHLRAADVVAEEMLQLKKRAGVQHVWFGDDVFALNHLWVEEFAAEVEIRDASIPFKIQSRADLMSEETVQHLKSAGCAEVWLGVESGSQKVLNAMDKGLSLASVIAARHRLKEADIRACFFLQLGYPGESWSELQQTIKLVRDLRPDDIGVSFSYPLPGTMFYERVKAQLGQKRNWIDSDDLCIMFNAAYTTDFYRAVRNALHAEVDTWGDEEARPERAAEVDALWRKVHDLEPKSRCDDAFAFEDGMAAIGSSVIIPVEEVMLLQKV